MFSVYDHSKSRTNALVRLLLASRAHYVLWSNFRYIPPRDKSPAYITEIHTRAMSVPRRAV